MTAHAGEPLRLHPDNNRYFQFHGRTTVLVGSSEHYGALLNTDFDYLRYLNEVRACGLNFVRIFSGAYRETPGSFNIANNTLTPAAGRFITPWARSTVAGASDGGNKFDLSQWDAAYFQRLRDLVREAETRGIVVELTLFSSFYNAALWAASPMNAANHINGVGAGTLSTVHQPDSDLLPYQKALARKCAEELRDHSNVFIEIINEPYFTGVPETWQSLITDEIVAAEASFPQRHLIAWNTANYEGVISNPHPAVSIFNFHYANPNAALANLGLGKPLGDDETGLAGSTDFPYRREAWEFMLSGGSLFNHLDFSFTADREDGIDALNAPGGGGPAIRRQLGVLRWFLEELPLTRCVPLTGIITGGVPSGGAARAFGVTGEVCAIYLRGGSQANLDVTLPAETYCGRWIDPRSGKTTLAVAEFIHAGGTRTISSPAYSEDAALILWAGSTPPPEVTLTAPVHQTVVAEDAMILLKAEATVSGTLIERIEFLDGEEVLGNDTDAPYALTLPQPGKGSRLFRARAVTADGRSARSQPVKCAVSGSHQTAVNLNGETVSLNGRAWLSQTDAIAFGMQLENTQAITTNSAIPLYPATDTAVITLVSNQLVRPNTPANPALAISQPLLNGTYDVFIMLIEGEVGYQRDIRVLIEGQVAAIGIGNLSLGEWVNYGPYRTTVTDGVLNIGLLRETKGSPKIASFSVHQAQPAVAVADATLAVTNGNGIIRLSWPAGVPVDRIESSTSLDENADWQPVNRPVMDFTDHQELLVPTSEPRRFFRLRKE
jgi:hypothetical protein